MISPDELVELESKTKRFYAVSTDTVILLINEIRQYHKLIDHIAAKTGETKAYVYALPIEEICKRSG